MTQKRIAFLAGAALIAMLLLNFLYAAAAVSVGDSPEMSFRSVDGKNISLKDLKGKMVLVDFWATWCGPCMAEAGHMVETNNKYAEKGLQIIGISLDADRAELQNVVKEKGFVWPQYYDGRGWDNRFAKEWGVHSIPRTFLIDPTGKVVWMGHSAAMDQSLADAFIKTPPVLVDPAIVKQAEGTMETVEASLKAGNTAAAIKQFALLPPDARKDGKIDARAKEAETQLASAAEAMLTDVEPMIQQKQFVAATTKLREVVAALGATPSAAKAKKRLSEVSAMPEAQAQIAAAQKDAKASEELAIAQKLQAEGKNELAFTRYQQIVKQFPSTDAGKTAAQAVKMYESDPAFVRRANESTAAGKAKGMLALAQSYRAASRTDLARKKYQEVIDTFPGTSFATTAAKALAELGR
jgi:thiol-disulfide isomerase/thioredoxin